MQVSLHNINQDSDAALKLINAVQEVYQAVKRFVSTYVIAIFSLLLIPFAFLLLEVLVFFLCRKVQRIDLTMKDHRDYTRIRKSFDELNKNLASRDKILNANYKRNLPTVLFRWFIKRLTKPFQLHQSNIEKALKKLDEPWIGEYKGFRQISEAEGWENRSKAYEYLV